MDLTNIVTNIKIGYIQNNEKVFAYSPSSIENIFPALYVIAKKNPELLKYIIDNVVRNNDYILTLGKVVEGHCFVLADMSEYLGEDTYFTDDLYSKIDENTDLYKVFNSFKCGYSSELSFLENNTFDGLNLFSILGSISITDSKKWFDYESDSLDLDNDTYIIFDMDNNSYILSDGNKKIELDFRDNRISTLLPTNLREFFLFINPDIEATERVKSSNLLRDKMTRYYGELNICNIDMDNVGNFLKYALSFNDYESDKEKKEIIYFYENNV